MLFQPCTINSPFDGTKYNDNMTLIEESLLDLGPYVISGLDYAAGTGLSVDVNAGVASIGGRVDVTSGFTIAGLADNTTNHIYILNTGGGTSNTTGNPPANSAKLGTCTTSGGAVTAVQMGLTSGRQQFIQPQDLIPGGAGTGIISAGQPASINLANWAAAAGEAVSVYGTLPAAALDASPPTYTVTNPTTNRSLDETTGTLSDVAQVLGTLIQDLQAKGILG